MAKKKTHLQFLEDLNLIGTDITVFGEYLNKRSNIKVGCNVCGHIWTPTANNLMSGRGCPRCAGRYVRTHESFVEELKAINPNLDVIGSFENSVSPIKVRCLVDNHTWSPNVRTLLDGCGCPVCKYRKSLKPKERFEYELSIVNKDIRLIGEYITGYTETEFKCDIDSNKWSTTPNKILKSGRCPECTKAESKQNFLDRLQSINNKIVVISEFENWVTKVKCLCLVDGHEWNSKPGDLINGHGCPKCSKSGFDSTKESVLYVYRFSDYYGFGITNNFNKRHSDHKINFKKHGVCDELIKTYHAPGKVILEVEKELKRTLPIANTGIAGFKTEAVLQEDGILLFREIDRLLKVAV